MGFAGRLHGLTLDGIEAIDVVTADGRLRHRPGRRPVLGAARRRRQLRDRHPPARAHLRGPARRLVRRQLPARSRRRGPGRLGRPRAGRAAGGVGVHDPGARAGDGGRAVVRLGGVAAAADRPAGPDRGRADRRRDRHLPGRAATLGDPGRPDDVRRRLPVRRPAARRRRARRVRGRLADHRADPRRLRRRDRRRPRRRHRVRAPRRALQRPDPQLRRARPREGGGRPRPPPRWRRSATARPTRTTRTPPCAATCAPGTATTSRACAGSSAATTRTTASGSARGSSADAGRAGAAAGGSSAG